MQGPGPYGYPPHPQYGYPPPQAQYGYQPQPYPPHSYAPPPPPPQPQQPAGVPYIGARISLISNMNIRYEGILYTIDTKASTVALQHVRCFGTENRTMDGQGYVPPSNDIYEFIIFGGKDIKDIKVMESMPEPAPLHDPAIVSQQQVPPQQNDEAQQPQEPHTNATADAAEPVDAATAESSSQENPQSAPSSSSSSAPSKPQRGERPHRGGRGGGANKQHTVRLINEESQSSRRQPGWSGSNSAVGQAQPASAPEDLKGEFDFSASNEKFSKLAVPKPAAASSSSDELVPSYDLPSAGDLDANGFPVVKKAYNKSLSFFDALSTDKSTSDRRVDSRRVDVDTFGSDAANFRPRHGRGGHRGRGGYRGRGGRQGGNNWRQEGGGQ